MVSRSQIIKLKPNKAQSIALAKAAGASRYVYNWALDKWKELHEADLPRTAYHLMHLWTIERPEWALEVNTHCLQRPCMQLQGALNVFFKGIAGFPKYRKRGVNDSAYFPNTDARLVGKRRVRFSKIGDVRMMEDFRYKDCKIMSYIAVRKADGWYVVIRGEVDEDRRTESTTFVGVDVGCKNFAVASDGTVCKTPAQLKDIEKQIKRRQRLMDRKQNGSNNHEKARNKLARAWQRYRRVKYDAIHKFTAKIAKSHGTVCIETLDIKSMQSSKNKYARKGVQNSAMGEILNQLKYKCNNYISVGSNFPSSKTCSNCGHIKSDLTVRDRTYHCPSCGYTIDRDLNAAINLRNEGLRIYTAGHAGSACGEMCEQLELAL